ncbi:ShlB/FhaC/HecB family hemolysin secretion/activation protein [Geobacter pelophilus]|uniref:ShlB/FhaC/HecB family hemolysin secretion/activation protein n=1 Tax=Geoanaerobacter pelophilus TaxID=60036 RepID=A0AAW4L7J4_9BACT|nr:ShlB/FhaC/HecB family hemolysin secretion/activation protein [Geoanaerobacter pelophilus]MBT0666137.1 ShlB/FhaC/HecB family hemolysin secretion/activation protein [Geoanaerobacter pelophilus]
MRRVKEFSSLLLSVCIYVLSLAICQAAEQPTNQPLEGEIAAEAAEQPVPPVEAAPAAEDSFEIRSFIISGATIFPEPVLIKLLDDLTGQGKTAADVEGARDRLERFFHEGGYPAVLVNIPEQSTEGGAILLQVIEGKVGKVTVTGNSWFSNEMILERLPAFTTGDQVFVPRIAKEISRVNANPDLKVTPGMSPSKEPGMVDFELKTVDRMPIHGSVEVNNRNSLNTSELRLNAALRHDNLWQSEHSLSVQYQTSPQEPEEVEVFSGSYTAPLPWNPDQKLVLYGVLSDSATGGFGTGFKTLGKGNIIGLRYLRPLIPVGCYSHNLTLGIDYKRFEESSGFTTKITYLPFSIAYGGALPDAVGVTSFNVGINLAFRGMVTDSGEFDAKRSRARGNYIMFIAGIERLQKLGSLVQLKLKVDGQLSDQPLISNEQYSAGGMESVRGYYENEASGDIGLRSGLELMVSDLVATDKAKWFQITPYLFFDHASLWVKEPLPGQTSSFTLMGTGAGLRGSMFRDLEYQVEGAFALRDIPGTAANTQKGDARTLFKVKYSF